jgi:iron complex outermembrane receptor protein
MRLLLLCASSFGAIGTASTACAQNSSATTAETQESKPATGQAIPDIIVTANRTASSAQDTPIALNAYTGDTLRDQGVSSVRDLALIDPSVNVSSTGGAGYVAIRGIASTDFTEIGDPSVPVARDGFFTNRSYSINSSMYDVERVEVLKGPQGTLNGRNSTGGLVSIITNRPEMRDGGYASVDVGNFGTFIGEAGANLKIADGFAIRASTLFNHHDGYRKLDGPARYGDDEDFASGRIQALYRSRGFSLWASYQHDSRDVNGDAVVKGPQGGPKPDFDAESFANFAPTYTKLEGDRFRWEASYEGLAGLNLIYSGGYDKQTWRNETDQTGPAYPANRQFRQVEQPGTWNHEFRISNGKGKPLFFQAGYFRFTENNTSRAGLYNLDMTGLFAPGGPLAFLAQPDQYGITFDYAIKTTSQAVFGQAEYDLTDRLQLSVGGRYTWDEKRRTGQAVLFLPALASPFAPPLTIVTPDNGHVKEGKPTWHVGLNFRPAGKTLIYIKYDRGYKSGGFNTNGSADSVAYGAETIDAFEIGAKNSLLDNRLRLNLSAFYFNYKGYQATQATTILGGGSGIFNVGNARIYGAEAEIVAMLSAHTRLNLNGSYISTRFGDNIFAADGSGTSLNIGGNRLPNAPEFSASAGIEHGFEFTGGTVTARIDGRYSSDFYYSVFNQPDTKSDAYFLANASLKFSPAGQPWEIQAYIRNIFDEKVLAYAARNFVSTTNNYQLQPPRTFGIRGNVKF